MISWDDLSHKPLTSVGPEILSTPWTLFIRSWLGEHLLLRHFLFYTTSMTPTKPRDFETVIYVDLRKKTDPGEWIFHEYNLFKCRSTNSCTQVFHIRSSVFNLSDMHFILSNRQFRREKMADSNIRLRITTSRFRTFSVIHNGMIGNDDEII